MYKKVLVTGGTGSLGQALLRRAEKETWNTEFVILSRDESKQSKLKKKYPYHRYVLGDVSRKEDVDRAIHGVDTVFHFAAYKQVPSSQAQVSATLNSNVVGSRNVALSAVEHDVERVVATSTDKACAPVNYYGASKLMMEGIFQEANTWGTTIFTLARYGNVACSSQSVAPLFLSQIQNKQPLTVTSYEMTRFWLSLDQAINLVLLALQCEGGIIVVPKAPAMSMGDLAVAMATPNGLEVVDIGIRPGEKIHECMVHASESRHTVEEDEHFFIYPATAPYEWPKRDDFTYTSDKPVRWLTWDEMKELVRNAGIEINF